jgi:hypothetical protein
VHRARRGRGDAGQWTIRDFFRGGVDSQKVATILESL